MKTRVSIRTRSRTYWNGDKKQLKPKSTLRSGALKRHLDVNGRLCGQPAVEKKMKRRDAHNKRRADRRIRTQHVSRRLSSRFSHCTMRHWGVPRLIRDHTKSQKEYTRKEKLTDLTGASLCLLLFSFLSSSRISFVFLLDADSLF